MPSGERETETVQLYVCNICLLSSLLSLLHLLQGTWVRLMARERQPSKPRLRARSGHAERREAHYGDYGSSNEQKDSSQDSWEPGSSNEQKESQDGHDEDKPKQTPGQSEAHFKTNQRKLQDQIETRVRKHKSKRQDKPKQTPRQTNMDTMKDKLNKMDKDGQRLTQMKMNKMDKDGHR